MNRSAQAGVIRDQQKPTVNSTRNFTGRNEVVSPSGQYNVPLGVGGSSLLYPQFSVRHQPPFAPLAHQSPMQLPRVTHFSGVTQMAQRDTNGLGVVRPSTNSPMPRFCDPLTTGLELHHRMNAGLSPAQQQLFVGPFGEQSRQPHSATSATLSQMSQMQRLKVEDALSYLDQVKMQFGDKPKVYNDFLDIMKEFKAQSIDTPGVIQRVSHIFRGHPGLIVGFNTFLPPGYRIELQGEAGDRVGVMTPNGQCHTISSDGEIRPVISSHQPSVNANSNHSTAALNVVSSAASAPPAPPLEFNHAITYVNKIKNRFLTQPDIYKQFLEILHDYQKEQRKDSVLRPSSEAEVLQKVAQLFQHEEDLLLEFSLFLPDASATSLQSFAPQIAPQVQSLKNSSSSGIASPEPHRAQSAGLMSQMSPGQKFLVPKTESSAVSPSPTGVALSSQHILESIDATLASKQRKEAASPTYLDSYSKKPRKKESRSSVSYSEVTKYGTFSEHQFFDKVRKALKYEDVYDNFLRCLVLFNKDLISRTELLQIITPFLVKFPDYLKWLKDFLGVNEFDGFVEPIPPKAALQERISSDLALEIDYATCKKYGASYRALPKSYALPVCSGRSDLCYRVLNDTWVSFPSWSSEDTSFVSSKKTQYEEFIYRTEDERFELDTVIETNLATMRDLEVVQKRMEAMTTEELSKYRLDERLGGRSAVLNKKSIRRVYGDKGNDIIEGLQRNPGCAVPLVLKRLKCKNDEWVIGRKNFNQIWREQNEKYYLKSLDHQGINFKQTDLKNIRSKALLNQIETLYDERRELAEEGRDHTTGPHMVIVYPPDKQVFVDAADLIIHHVKRQTGMQPEEKAKIKRLLKKTIPDMFRLDPGNLSDDEDEDPDDEEEEMSSKSSGTSHANGSQRYAEVKEKPKRKIKEMKETQKATGTEKPMVHCGYSLMFVPNSWYVFLRLHCLLCERLWKIRQFADHLAEQDEIDRKVTTESAAEGLNLRPKPAVPVSQYFVALTQLVKNLLDGQIDANRFEDSVREMFTINAYLTFTMDKIIQTAVRQLQAMVAEEICLSSLQLYDTWKSRGGAGGLVDATLSRGPLEEEYQKGAEELLADQNCFKAIFSVEDRKVSFELLDTDSMDASEEGNHSSDEEKMEESCQGQEAAIQPSAVNVKKVENVQKWIQYIEEYVSSDATLPTEAAQALLSLKPVFMMRNKNRTQLDSNDPAVNAAMLDDPSEAPTDSQGSGRVGKKRKGEPIDGVTPTKRIREAGESTDEEDEVSSVETVSATDETELNRLDELQSTNSTQVVCNDDQVPSVSSQEEDVAVTDGPSNRTATRVRSQSVSDMAKISLNEESKEPLQRSLSADMGVYDENTVRFISPYELWRRYLGNQGLFFYRRDCLKRAHQTHRQISEVQHRRFSSWHQKWTLTNVSMDAARLCTEWLMGLSDMGTASDSGTGERLATPSVSCLRLQQNDPSKPPYYLFSRYVQDLRFSTPSSSVVSSQWASTATTTTGPVGAQQLSERKAQRPQSNETNVDGSGVTQMQVDSGEQFATADTPMDSST